MCSTLAEQLIGFTKWVGIFDAETIIAENPSQRDIEPTFRLIYIPILSVLFNSQCNREKNMNISTAIIFDVDHFNPSFNHFFSLFSRGTVDFLKKNYVFPS